MRDAQLIHRLTDMQALASQVEFEPMRERGREGVEVHRLYDTEDTGPQGPAAALVRYQPGASVSRHMHPGYELILVLDGVLENDSGRHGPGTLEVCPPGSSHALGSSEGCTFLVVWEQPPQLVPQQAAE